MPATSAAANKLSVEKNKAKKNNQEQEKEFVAKPQGKLSIAGTDSTANKKPASNTPVTGEDDSKWDSDDDDDDDDDDNVVSSDEEVLPPRTPERGSDFEPFSSGDEESDFSLGESYAKVYVYLYCFHNNMVGFNIHIKRSA